MICIDSSVLMKWFKSGERYEIEAQDLRTRIERQEVQATVNQIATLEVLRGLKVAQARDPSIAGQTILDALSALDDLRNAKRMAFGSVSDVEILARDIIMTLGLPVADSLHLATAVDSRSTHFVTDDQHFMTPAVMTYATGLGVRIVDLPQLIADLNLATGQAP